MSQLQVIETALKGAARRQRTARALQGLFYGLLVGATLALIVSGVYHVRPLPMWSVLVAAFLPFPFMLAGALIGASRKLTLSQTARWVDRRQHLQERLSTALEVAGDEKDRSGAWGSLVISDAAAHAKSLDPRRMIAFKLPRVARWAAVILALLAGLGFVPEYRSPNYKKLQAEQQNVKDTAKQLADLTRRSLEVRPPVRPETQKSLEAVASMADQMTRATFTRNEALKELSNMADKVKDDLKELQKDPALRRMEETARNAGGADPQTGAGLQKQMESLQKQLGTPVGNPEAMDKIKKELDKLQEAAKAMADKNSPGSESDKQKMSEALSALSRQMQEMGMQMPQLDDAISAMANNQTDLVLKDLQAATTDLEKMRDMAKSLQQLQQQMEKLGKDLAEQLKNGQPEAAQQTLQKMSDQLKNSSLSQEQKQQIMKDVAAAVPPAANYGNVADKLKQAGQQMQAGKNPDASKSLADAAQELGKLMQQMGDAQQMMAELENLNKASQCVGQCQKWGMGTCNKPGVGDGNNRPGGGVGTWANENGGWMYDGTWSDHWDNSGFARPDLAPKGHSDRNSDLNEGLSPTKVKGQFSPGGNMPSITLKGVSIKGASKVEYEAAAAAAQSDAQSALNQEKVPRAYQGAVRDYFDDIKK